MVCPSPAGPEGADADVALSRHHVAARSHAGRHPGHRHVSRRVAAATHRPVRTVVEHRRQAVLEQEAILGLRRPLCHTAAHCAAPVPHDQPSSNPVRDEGHAHEAHRRDHLHAGGVPGHARRPRPRPLPAQRSLLRSARASCEEPDTRCGVCTSGAGTAGKAQAAAMGDVDAEMLWRRPAGGPGRPASVARNSAGV